MEWIAISALVMFLIELGIMAAKAIRHANTD